jgi:hypothetical protein
LRLAREATKTFAGQTIVAILTGDGLKESAIAAAPAQGPPVTDDPAALEAALA